MKKLLYLLLFIPFISFSQETKNVLNIDTIKEEYIKTTNYITYYDGEPYTGVLFRNYENGQLKFKSIFKDGRVNGLCEDYYENGQLHKKENYKDGMLNGLSETYYENGQPRRKSEWKKDELDKTYEEYFENGQLEFESIFKDGTNILIETKQYFKSGQLKIKSIYKNGKIDSSKRYNKNGQLAYTSIYKNGELKIRNSYYDNGQLASVTFDGYRNGLFKRYHQNGKLKAKGNYIGGKKNGLFKAYDLNGRLVENLIYKDGKIVTNFRLIIGDTNIEDVNVYDLEAMVKLFLKDCELNNIKLSSDYKITSTFETLDKGVLALAYGIFNDEEIIIKVNPQDWSNASNPKRWYILYHELGHDVLNLQHGQGGKMMFNYSEKDYNWEDFIKDKDYMFSSMKKE